MSQTGAKFHLKPAGITVLANLFRVAGGILAALGIAEIVTAVFLLVKLPYLTYLGLVSIIVGLVSVGTGTIGWWIGRGLWELKNWARISAIVLSVLSLFYVVLLVEMLIGLSSLAWLLFIPWLALVGLITWYLLSAGVEAAFRGYPGAVKPAAAGLPESYLPARSASRPTGVTVIAILCFVIAAQRVLLGLQLISLMSSATAMPAPRPWDLQSALRMLAQLWTSWGLGALTMGALAGLAGWGLWQRRQWARFLTISLAAVQLAFVASNLVRVLSHPRFAAVAIFLSMVFLIADAWTIWYLLSERRVRVQFE